MKSKIVLLTAFVVLVLTAMALATPVLVQQDKDVLTAGTYTANVKAIVCGGCAQIIKESLQGMKEIGSVSVDSAQKTVQFTVKENKSVKLADVQKVLKSAAKKMGMGADYTLSDLKPTK